MADQVQPPAGFPHTPPPNCPPPNYPPPHHSAGGAPGAPPPSQAPWSPYGAQYAPAVRPSPRWGLTITSVFLFFLLGLPALYFSSQVGERWQRGDAAGAANASKQARIWGIVAIVVGVFFILVLAGGGGG